jgi:hypothetical protein
MSRISPPLRKPAGFHSVRDFRPSKTWNRHPMQPTAQPQLISYLISGAVIALVMALRLRNIGRQRRLRLETLWVMPGVLVALTALAFSSAPPSPLTLLLCVPALLIGAAVGWQRGRAMHIAVDPETHELSQSTSRAALLFLLAIVAVRFGARALMLSGYVPVHVNPMALSDVLLSFALGMIGVARLEMYLRARRLLAIARGEG